MGPGAVWLDREEAWPGAVLFDREKAWPSAVLFDRGGVAWSCIVR